MKKAKFKMTGNGSRIEEVSESSCLCASVLKKDAGVVEDDFNTETQRRRGAEFKMTEIGLIPEDWEVKRLGDVCEKIRNGYGYDFREQGIYPMSRIETISSGEINYQRVVKIAEEPPVEYRLKVGDILYSHINSLSYIGNVAQYEGKEILYHGMNLLLLRPIEKVDSVYLKFLLKSEPMRNMAKSVAKVAINQASISTKELAQFPLVVPPLAEQKAIAEALSDVDALIAAQEELIEKKRAIKQGAMQELLTGKKRLPGFGGKWIEKRLGDCATMFAGGTPSSKIEGYYGGDIPWVSISDISIAGKYIERTAETLSDAGLNNSSAKWYPPNALLFAMYASIGKCCIAKERMTSSQAILGIYDLIDIDVEFLYYLLTFRNDEFLMMGQTGTQSNLSKAIVEEIVINTPSLAEQKAIAEVLSDMDAEISELEAQKAKFESIKQGMMQQLLTGKIRLV